MASPFSCRCSIVSELHEAYAWACILLVGCLFRQEFRVNGTAGRQSILAIKHFQINSTAIVPLQTCSSPCPLRFLTIVAI
jgi:hypothetical protein